MESKYKSLQARANEAALLLARVDIATYYRGNNFGPLMDLLRHQMSQAYIRGYKESQGEQVATIESLTKKVQELEELVREQREHIENQARYIESATDERQSPLLKELGIRLFPGVKRRSAA